MKGRLTDARSDTPFHVHSMSCFFAKGLRRDKDGTPIISTPDLEISFKGASRPNSRRVALNKTVCTNLGFAHLLSSKATPLLVSLKFSPTNEMTITSKLGTSLKPGWEGAELRAVLVRKAAGIAAKEDKEDEEDDA